MAERIKMDYALQQVIEPPIQITGKVMGRLSFQRWLATQGRLSQDAPEIYPSSGELAPKPVAVGPKSDFEQTQ